VFKHTDDYYYLTYTTHTWEDVSTTIGFAAAPTGSTGRSCTTTRSDHEPVPRVGPEWFVDSDGSVDVIVSCSTTDDEWIFTPYR